MLPEIQTPPAGLTAATVTDTGLDGAQTTRAHRFHMGGIASNKARKLDS